jgi:hypothetical protein
MIKDMQLGQVVIQASGLFLLGWHPVGAKTESFHMGEVTTFQPARSPLIRSSEANLRAA